MADRNLQVSETMNAFQLETTDTAVLLRLHGEVTIEEARPLQVALRTALLRPRRLAIESGDLVRIDAAVLQVLVAGVRAASGCSVPDPSPAWLAALERYALTEAFAPN